MPLGTAAWLTSSGTVLRPFQEGNLFLGNLPSGEEIGFRDDRHALIVAGTRSGKGASLIVPNLATWPGSVVVIDPKGENARVTARRRHKGSRYCFGRKQRTCILDPFNEVRTPEDSFSDVLGYFNPLDMIDARHDESVDIAARIAESLIVSENTSDPIWDNSAKDLLKGMILHIATSRDYRKEERNLITVQKMLRAGDARTREIALRANDDETSTPREFRP
jgi:type IV secretory pathway TraG/TraD family ATPase VirD4